MDNTNLTKEAQKCFDEAFNDIKVEIDKHDHKKEAAIRSIEKDTMTINTCKQNIKKAQELIKKHDKTLSQFKLTNSIITILQNNIISMLKLKDKPCEWTVYNKDGEGIQYKTQCNVTSPKYLYTTSESPSYCGFCGKKIKCMPLINT